jgi:hypothetical protein
MSTALDLSLTNSTTHAPSITVFPRRMLALP